MSVFGIRILIISMGLNILMMIVFGCWILSMSVSIKFVIDVILLVDKSFGLVWMVFWMEIYFLL